MHVHEEENKRDGLEVHRSRLFFFACATPWLRATFDVKVTRGIPERCVPTRCYIVGWFDWLRLSEMTGSVEADEVVEREIILLVRWGFGFGEWLVKVVEGCVGRRKSLDF